MNAGNRAVRQGFRGVRARSRELPDRGIVHIRQKASGAARSIVEAQGSAGRSAAGGEVTRTNFSGPRSSTIPGGSMIMTAPPRFRNLDRSEIDALLADALVDVLFGDCDPGGRRGDDHLCRVWRATHRARTNDRWERGRRGGGSVHRASRGRRSCRWAASWSDAKPRRPPKCPRRRSGMRRIGSMKHVRNVSLVPLAAKEPP